MALDALVRKAVAIADKVTGSLQVEVLHQAWIGSNDDASAKYATAVALEAIVTEGAKPRRTNAGEVVMTKARIALLAPVEPNGTTGRLEPLDPRDVLTLPSGTSGPVVDTDGGLVDPGTGRTYFMQAWI